jgi:hypothetical protein
MHLQAYNTLSVNSIQKTQPLIRSDKRKDYLTDADNELIYSDSHTNLTNSIRRSAPEWVSLCLIIIYLYEPDKEPELWIKN